MAIYVLRSCRLRRRRSRVDAGFRARGRARQLRSAPAPPSPRGPAPAFLRTRPSHPRRLRRRRSRVDAGVRARGRTRHALERAPHPPPRGPAPAMLRINPSRPRRLLRRRSRVDAGSRARGRARHALERTPPTAPCHRPSPVAHKSVTPTRLSAPKILRSCRVPHPGARRAPPARPKPAPHPPYSLRTHPSHPRRFNTGRSHVDASFSALAQGARVAPLPRPLTSPAPPAMTTSRYADHTSVTQAARVEATLVAQCGVVSGEVNADAGAEAYALAGAA